MKNVITFVIILATLVFANNRAIADQGTLVTGSLNGAFSSWGKSSLQGDWKIVKVDGKHYIELSDNFKAKEGPDVKIFLSPKNATNVTGDNATEGSVLVKQISSFAGKSRIEIPAGVDLSDYQSLVFHCEAYSKLWGSSPLSAS